MTKLIAYEAFSIDRVNIIVVRSDVLGDWQISDEANGKGG